MANRHNDMWPGKRFGMNVLIEKSRHPTAKGGLHCWLVRCDCGKERHVFANALRKGHSTSCGCAPRGPRMHKRTFANVAVLRVLNKYKRTAEDRGHEWLLEDHLFEAIIAYPCSYCGAPPSNKTHSRSDAIVYTGIDRIDNTLGYTPGNVIPCCHQCNWAKKNYSLSQFVSWARRVVETTAKLKIESDPA